MAYEDLERRNRELGFPVTEGRPTLKNWCFNGTFLTGNVYGHERFRDGQLVHTSVVMEINKEEGWAKTLNTYYILEGTEATDLVVE